MSILPHESRDGAAPNACATATHDPVCGMRADPLTARARCVHDGVPVGFCGGRCKERFLAEPLRPGEERARPGATVRHANRRYWFCGEACRERFEADPARFTGHAVPAPANAPVYTCPCHPAVRSAVPADCPECGMALEPRAAPTGGEPSPELADMRRRLAVACALTLPVLAIAMSEMVRAGVVRMAPGGPRHPGGASEVLPSPRRRKWQPPARTDGNAHDGRRRSPGAGGFPPGAPGEADADIPPYHSIRHAAPTRQSSSPGVCPASCVHPAWSTSFPAPHCRTRSSAIRTSRPSGGSPTRCSA